MAQAERQHEFDTAERLKEYVVHQRSHIVLFLRVAFCHSAVAPQLPIVLIFCLSRCCVGF